MKRKTPIRWFAPMIAVLMAIFLASMMFTGCALFQRGAGGTPSSAEQVAAAAAPLLPPPFGLIAGAVAAICSTAATVGATKSVNTATATNTSPSPIINWFTSHQWSLSAVGALVLLARTQGWLHMSDGELLMLMTACGIPQTSVPFQTTPKPPPTPAPGP